MGWRRTRESRAFHTRPIADEFVHVNFDAIHLQAHGTPRLIQPGLRPSALPR
jgi:hypothetical protein